MSAPYPSLGQDDMSLFFQAYEEMDSPIFLTDSRARVRWYNRAMTEHFGLSEVDSPAMDVRQFLSDRIAPFVRDDPAFTSEVAAAIGGGMRIDRRACHIVSGQEKGRWMAFSSTPILSGVLYGGRLNIFRDVTERHEGEEEIQQRNELESIVAEISAVFFGVSAADLESALCASLQVLGEFMGSDHCYLYIAGRNGSDCGQSYEWCAGEGAGSPALAGISVFEFPWASGTGGRSEAMHRIPTGRGRESVVIPLRGRSLTGFIGFDGETGGSDTFTRSSTLLAMAGGVLVNALERCQVEETLRRHDAICEAVMMATGSFLRSQKWEEIIGEVLERLGKGGEFARVYLVGDLDGHGEARIRHLWTDPKIAEAARDESTSLEGADRWSAALALGHVIAGNVRDLPLPVQPPFGERGVRSFAIAPVFAGERCWGRLCFEDCRRERAWTKPEVDTLKTAADSLGSTIERVEREHEIRHHNRRLVMINEIIGAAGSGENLDDLLGATLSRTLSIFGLESGAVYVISHDKNVAELRCTSGPETDVSSYPTRITPDAGFAHLVFVEGLIARGGADGPGAEGIDGSAPAVWVPLTEGGTALGALALSCPRGRQFSMQEMTALAAVGNEVGIAIRKAILQQELSESYEKANLYLDIMSHDIKNANTVSIMYADMLREQLQGEAKDFADRLMESIRRSIEITDHVSTIRRLHQERVVLREVDLDAVIRKEMDQFEGYRIHYARSSFMACADNLISEIFANLIGNAVKFGGPDVDIFIRLEARGGLIEVTVEDTGPGIPDSAKNSIFDRFQRGGRKASGKGLGLYIVRTLVERYGGVIRVRDRVPGHPEQGVSFRFTLRKAPDVHAVTDRS